MSDIVDRLRYGSQNELMFAATEAANLIERQRAVIEAVRVVANGLTKYPREAILRALDGGGDE